MQLHARVERPRGHLNSISKSGPSSNHSRSGTSCSLVCRNTFSQDSFVQRRGKAKWRTINISAAVFLNGRNCFSVRQSTVVTADAEAHPETTMAEKQGRLLRTKSSADSSGRMAALARIHNHLQPTALCLLCSSTVRSHHSATRARALDISSSDEHLSSFLGTHKPRREGATHTHTKSGQHQPANC